MTGFGYPVTITYHVGELVDTESVRVQTQIVLQIVTVRRQRRAKYLATLTPRGKMRSFKNLPSNVLHILLENLTSKQEWKEVSPEKRRKANRNSNLPDVLLVDGVLLRVHCLEAGPYLIQRLVLHQRSLSQA